MYRKKGFDFCKLLKLAENNNKNLIISSASVRAAAHFSGK